MLYSILISLKDLGLKVLKRVLWQISWSAVFSVKKNWILRNLNLQIYNRRDKGYKKIITGRYIVDLPRSEILRKYVYMFLWRSCQILCIKTLNHAVYLIPKWYLFIHYIGEILRKFYVHNNIVSSLLSIMYKGIKSSHWQ